MPERHSFFSTQISSYKRAWMHFTHKSQDTGVMRFIHSSGRGWSSEEAEEEEHGAGLFKCSKCWETKSPSQLWGWLPSQSVTVSLWGLLVMFASETVIFSDHFSHYDLWSDPWARNIVHKFTNPGAMLSQYSKNTVLLNTLNLQKTDHRIKTV